jgi:hypothetical protein
VRFRSLLLTGLALAACGETRLPSSTGALTGVGPDAILLRLPQNGGYVRAYRAGRDSVLWTSRDRAPASSNLLGFDEFLGLLVGRTAKGAIFSADLRLGAVEILDSASLGRDLRAEGSAVFGLDPTRGIVRVTPVSRWEWTPPGGADALVPLPDGSLLALSDTAERTRVVRLIPPETQFTDSVILPAVKEVLRTPLGDRVWFVTANELIGLRARDLTPALSVRLSKPATGIESTPSGDRLYIATTDASLRVIDRFTEREGDRIDLPGPALAMRMDPDGRYLLVRTAESDSILVVSVGTGTVVATHAAAWREDLPMVTPDGRLLLARGRDVYHVDAESGRQRLRYRGGADDLWLQVRWNGFRPRAVGIDQPVEFEGFAADSAAADSALAAMMTSRFGDLGALTRPPAPPSRDSVHPTDSTAREIWTVSFATLLSEERARDLSTRIRVDGRTARVIAGNRDGIPIWRVVLGPFDTRDAAERAGMASRLPYWVFEGAP